MITETQRATLLANLKRAMEANRKRWEAAGVSLICQHCGTSFKVSPSAAKAGRVTCSNSCRYAYKRGERGANFGGGKWMKGEMNPNWKGGASEGRHNLHKRDPRVHRWRRLVLARDGYRCQRCGAGRKHRLVAHHVKAWRKYPETRFDPGNGVCLCRKCHLWVHSKRNENREFIEG